MGHGATRELKDARPAPRPVSNPGTLSSPLFPLAVCTERCHPIVFHHIATGKEHSARGTKGNNGSLNLTSPVLPSPAIVRVWMAVAAGTLALQTAFFAVTMVITPDPTAVSRFSFEDVR